MNENVNQTTILIVEDDEGLNRLIRKNLQRESFRTEGALNGKNAIAKITENPNIILLLDYMLPDMNGKQFIQVLTEKNINVPFIVITSQGDENIAVEMMKMGARDYIIKDTNFIDILPEVIKKTIKELDREKMLVKAEKALQESEKKYRLLADNTIDCIWQTDLDANYTYINPAIYSILGFTPEEWIGSNLSEHCPPEEMEKMRMKMLEAIDNFPNIKSLTFETIFYNKCGDEVSAEVTGKVLSDDTGNPAGFQGITRDITERKKAEEKLRESEERFRGFFESLKNIPVQGYNSDREVIYWNPASEKTYGYTRQEANGCKLEDLIIPDHMRDGVIESVNRWLNEGIHIPSSELVLRRKDGSDVYVYCSHVMVTNYRGEKEMFCVDVDITDRKKSEEEKKKLEEQLFQAQKMESIGRLAGGIAHDFNNILTGIMGYAELLKMQFNGTSTSEEKAVGVILKGVERAADLTQQLLGFARGGKYNPVPLKINNVIKDVIKISEKIFEKNIKVTYDFEKNINTIEADKNQMDQVLTNLIINAKDAMPNGGGDYY